MADKYVMMKEIVDVAIQCEGTVFGGYVRDFILHDYMARKYFDNKDHTKDTFSDPDFDPETKDRVLIPNDIDIHFRAYKDFRKFKIGMKALCFKSRTIRTSSLYTTESNVKHVALEVHPVMSKSDIQNVSKIIKRHFTEFRLPFHVKVDVVISKESDPPFNNLDFQCNGLVMNSNGIELCKDLSRQMNHEGKFRLLMSIIDDIRNKKAVLINLIASRWDKMADKDGWKLIGGNIEKVPLTDTECIICHEGISENDTHKFVCCSATYHMDCMIRALMHGDHSVMATNRCIHCRQRLILTEAEKGVFTEPMCI